MYDRVSQNPGRVLITPEDGSGAFYATLALADNPTVPGTPLNAATLCSQETAALFGLGADAVPDDVFNALTTRKLVQKFDVIDPPGRVDFELTDDDLGKLFTVVLTPKTIVADKNAGFNYTLFKSYGDNDLVLSNETLVLNGTGTFTKSQNTYGGLYAHGPISFRVFYDYFVESTGAITKAICLTQIRKITNASFGPIIQSMYAEDYEEYKANVIRFEGSGETTDFTVEIYEELKG